MAGGGVPVIGRSIADGRRPRRRTLCPLSLRRRCAMELKREVLSSQFLDPRRDFQPTTGSVEVRWDPLTGRASRLVQGSNLLPTSDFDLGALAEETRGSCFFC